MIGYTLKHVLDLVPEALPLVKQASLEHDLPLSSRDDVLASALVGFYKDKVASSPWDIDTMQKVASAVTAFGLDDKVTELSITLLQREKENLVKRASLTEPQEFMEKQAAWTNGHDPFKTADALSEEADALFKQAMALDIEPTDKVNRYSANLYLSKEAALGALSARFQATRQDTFVKIAAALSSHPDFIVPCPLTKSLCQTVTGLDKKAGLTLRGFDFYKEVLIEKSAAANSMGVTIGGQNFPIQRVLALPSDYTDQYLGKGFSQELNSDPASAKAMVESLPADSQHVLVTLLKNAG